MNRQTDEDRSYYSSSLSPLQVDFVRDRIGNEQNVKNLIRLVKHWRMTVFQVYVKFYLLFCLLN